MSLRDQFLKSGLITKKQANKVSADKKRQEHRLQKDHEFLQATQFVKQKEAQERTQEIEAQKQRDKELNKKRDEIFAQRENIFRVLQIINANAQNIRKSEEMYFFAENNFVRKVYVTAWQREMLSRGALAIVKPDHSVEDFVIIPRSATKIIFAICPEKIIVLHSEIENLQDSHLTLEKED